jgi:general secretion pathway protein G
MKSRKGFTLIEMLIVVAIIAILAGSVLVGLGPVQRQGRDSRRIADLRQVQNALELYYNKCGYYPGDAAAPSCPGSWANPADWAALSTVVKTSGLGVNQVPNDPSANKNYDYQAANNGTTYVLRAQLEAADNPNFAKDIDNAERPTGITLDCDDANRYYCIVF